jgi:hypothetical protein
MCHKNAPGSIPLSGRIADFFVGKHPRPPIFINLEEFMFGPAAPLLNERLIDVYTILN